MRKFLILLAVFLVILFAGCSNNKPETETTTETTTELTTVETTEEITEEVAKTTTKAPDTTKAPETPKPAPKPTEAPTKSPETTKKQETKPVVNQNDDVEIKDKDREEVPTYADGSFDMGAMKDEALEELGGEDFYF